MNALLIFAGFIVGILIVNLLFSSGPTTTGSASAYSTTTIHELNGPEDVERLIQSNQEVYILFMASWCGHCKTLKPMFHNLSSQFPNAVFAQVDCASHQSVPQKFNVEAFPCLRRYSGGVQKGEMMGSRRDEATLKHAMESM